MQRWWMRYLCSLCMVFMLLGFAMTASANPKQISIMARSAWEPFITEAIALFEAQHPDIQVEYRVNVGTDQLLTHILAGSAPDIFESNGPNLRRLAEFGALYDLAPMVARDFTAEDVQDFFPTVWNATYLDSGLQIGLPIYLNVPVFWFNRTLFEQAGLRTPDELEAEANWTWDTMLESAQKITRVNSEGDPEQYGIQTKYWNINLIQRPTWIWANGGNVFDYPHNPNQFVLDSPAAIGALEFVHSLIFSERVMAPNNLRSEFPFVSGKLGMDDDGIELFRRWEDAIGDNFEYDIVSRPMGAVSRGDRTSFDVWGMAQSTTEPDAAWEFLRFLTSPEIQRLQARTLWLGPTRRSAVDGFVELTDQINLRVYLDAASNASIDPFSLIENVTEFRQIMQPALESAFHNNEKSVRIAIEEVAPAIRELYKQ